MPLPAACSALGIPGIRVGPELPGIAPGNAPGAGVAGAAAPQPEGLPPPDPPR